MLTLVKLTPVIYLCQVLTRTLEHLAHVSWYMGFSIGSSSWVGVGRGKKHKIYLAAFGGHLFYDLFLQGYDTGI